MWSPTASTPTMFDVVARNDGSNVPSSHIEYSQINEEAWLIDQSDTEAHVFKTRLLGKPSRYRRGLPLPGAVGHHPARRVLS